MVLGEFIKMRTAISPMTEDARRLASWVSLPKTVMNKHDGKRVSGFGMRDAGGRWPLNTFRSSIFPPFQSSILSLLLAAGVMVALTPRAEADWTGSASGSQTYDDIANWNGGTGPINDQFIRINNSGFVLNFNNNRTTVGDMKFAVSNNNSITLQPASGTKTITLGGNIVLSGSEAGNYAPFTFSSSLIFDLNGSARVFYTPNQRAVTFSPKITGTGGLTVQGWGGAAFTMNNTANDWTGTLTIQNAAGGGGGWTCGNSDVIPHGVGKGAVTVNASLNLNGKTETINDLSGNANGTIDGNGTLIVLSYNDTSYAGRLVSGASQNLTKSGSAQLTLSGTAANTHGGVTTVNEGTLALQKTAGVNAIAAALTIGDGAGTDTVKLLNANQIANTVNVTFSAGSAPTLNLNGNSEAVNAINGSAGAIIDGTSGTPTLTVGAGNGSGGFTGVVQNTAGSLALVKSGTGTQTLANVNTYIGDTTVSGGRLRIGASASIASTNIFVGAGATLQLDNSTSLPDTAKLDLNSTGIVNLNFGSGREQVGPLWINSSKMPSGMYSATSHPANFSGSGILQVGSPEGTVFIFR